MSALKEIVDRYEGDLRREHSLCPMEQALISRARAELKRGVDVRAIAIAAGVLPNDTGTLHAIRAELSRQGVRVVEDGKGNSDGK